MNLRAKLTDLGASVLIALMLSLSLTEAVLESFSAPVSVWTAAALCLAFSLFGALMLFNRLTAALSLAAAAMLAVYLALTRSPVAFFTRIVQSMSAVLTGQGAMAAPEALGLCVLLALVFGIMSLFLVRMSGGVYPALLLFVFVLLGHWIMDAEFSAVTLAPGLIALAVLYARAYREKGAILRALPAALIAAALTLMLLPAPGSTFQPLQDCADKVRELFNDYFRFDDPRTVYSVSGDGYQPRSDMLGGRAEPRSDSIMTVESGDTLLLRGSISRTYTGANWVDEAVNSRYLLVDPTRRKRLEAAFNADLNENLKGCLKKIEATVTFNRSGTSTLFVPARLDSLNVALDIVTYYNETGEVFITRDVEAGDSYGISGWIVDATREDLISAVNAAADASDAHWLDVCNAYMALPAGIEAELYWLTMDVVKDCETPIEKAYAIADYLRGGFVYTLDGAYPPEGRDFVSWFVLDEKKGYCTYYASAMAVMARLAGIPSRYAEGYCAVDDGTGTIEVLAEDAHAWAELYFNGIGWLEFDVTPGTAYSSRHIVPPGEEQQDSQLPPPTATPTPEPTPEPTEAPVPDEPEPSDEPEGEPSSEPTDEPTPEPDNQPDEPTPSPEPDSDQQNDPPKKRRTLWWILILIAALCACAALWVKRRLVLSEPGYRAAKAADERERALIWYRAILTLLMRRGLSPDGGETPVSFARRVVSQAEAPRDFALFAELIEEMQYSGRMPDISCARLGEAIYGAMLVKLDRRERAKWALERLRHGLGDTRQIP